MQPPFFTELADFSFSFYPEHLIAPSSLFVADQKQQSSMVKINSSKTNCPLTQIKCLKTRIEWFLSFFSLHFILLFAPRFVGSYFSKSIIEPKIIEEKLMISLWKNPTLKRELIFQEKHNIKIKWNVSISIAGLLLYFLRFERPKPEYKKGAFNCVCVCV